MQRRKKQLLGLVGLALVAAVTAIACALPTPDASAYSTGSIPVTVRVGVDGDAPSIQILRLEDKDVVMQQAFEVDIEYTNADSVAVKLTNSSNGKSYNIPTGHCPIAGQVAEKCTLNFNLAETELWNTTTARATEGTGINTPAGVSFTTQATARNATSGAEANDDVSFIYRAAYLKDYTNEKESNQDPIVYAGIGGSVEKVQIQVYDQNGKPVFVDANGNETPLTFDKSNYGADGNDNFKISLPLTQYGAQAGKYSVVLTAFDNADVDAESTNLIALSTLSNIPYKTGGGSTNPDDPNKPVDPDDPNKPVDPDKPEVPGTGVRLFGGMNISSADYIITGLVAFGMVTAFAIFLIIRRSKRQ